MPDLLGAADVPEPGGAAGAEGRAGRVRFDLRGDGLRRVEAHLPMPGNGRSGSWTPAVSAVSSLNWM